MTLHLETISRAKRRLHIEATLATGILSARRAVALAKIDQLVVTEDAQLIAAAEAEAADAESLAASLKKQHEEHQVDKGRDEICRSMLDGLQRSSAHVVDMLAKVADDGHMTASNLHQVLQALGFRGATHEDAVAVFARWVAREEGAAREREAHKNLCLKELRGKRPARKGSRPLWRCRSCSSAALGSTAAESPHAPHARPWELPPRLRADPVHTSPHAASQRRSTTSAAPAPLRMP